MLKIITSVLTATLLVSSAFAADTSGPLQPGKPAGTTQAQIENHMTGVYVLGGLSVIAIAFALASSNSAVLASVTPAASSATTTTTTTTATTT